jgi:hypothetical protein
VREAAALREKEEEEDKPANNPAGGRWAPPVGVLSWVGGRTKRDDGTRDDRRRRPLRDYIVVEIEICDVLLIQNARQIPRPKSSATGTDQNL